MELPWNLGSSAMLAADGVICAHLLAALAVGVVVGYERSFKGHSAGMRTYALVCMATTGLVLVCGFPQLWYDQHPTIPVVADPHTIIQGIVTGIGFIGGGVIMKDGLSVRGLASAALIWAMAAIGVMIGLGFYGASFLMAALCLAVMSVVRRMEKALPHHAQVHLVMTFDRDHVMAADALRSFLAGFGYQPLALACEADSKSGDFVYDLVLESSREDAFNSLVDGLAKAAHVSSFRVTPVQD